MASSKLTTKTRQQIAWKNPLETGKRSMNDFFHAMDNHVKENIQAAPDDFFNQLLGVSNYENTRQELSSREMKPGEEITLSRVSDRKEEAKPEKRSRIAAGIEYHAEVIRNRERMSKRETQEIQYQIQQIINELRRLVSSSDKIIQMTYGQVTVDLTPTIVGKYHTNFFAWMLTVIRTARQKVEDSGVWLHVAKNKGSKRGYWDQFKKQGTSFSMSSERMVATQTG